MSMFRIGTNAAILPDERETVPRFSPFPERQLAVPAGWQAGAAFMLGCC